MASNELLVRLITEFRAEMTAHFDRLDRRFDDFLAKLEEPFERTDRRPEAGRRFDPSGAS